MVEISRRDLLKGLGVAALVGAGAATQLNGDDEIDFDSTFYQDSYVQTSPNEDFNAGIRNLIATGGQEPVHRVNANRGVYQVGYSSPDGKHTAGICKGNNDGYIEHRFVTVHFSTGMREKAGYEIEGLKINKRTQCTITDLGGELAMVGNSGEIEENEIPNWLKTQDTGNNPSLSTCRRGQIALNHEAISKFPIADILSDQPRHTEPKEQMKRAAEGSEIDAELDTRAEPLALISMFLGFADILVAGASSSNITIGYVGAGASAFISWPAVGAIIIVGSLATAIYSQIQYETQFEMDGSQLKTLGQRANSEGLVNIVDFSIRVPPGQSTVVDVEQQYEWDPNDAPFTVPSPIPFTRKTRIFIPANETQVGPGEFKPAKLLQSQFDNDPGTDATDVPALGQNNEAHEAGHGGTRDVNTDVLAGMRLNDRFFTKKPDGEALLNAVESNDDLPDVSRPDGDTSYSSAMAMSVFLTSIGATQITKNIEQIEINDDGSIGLSLGGDGDGDIVDGLVDGIEGAYEGAQDAIEDPQEFAAELESEAVSTLNEIQDVSIESIDWFSEEVLKICDDITQSLLAQPSSTGMTLKTASSVPDTGGRETETEYEPDPGRSPPDDYDPDGRIYPSVISLDSNDAVTEPDKRTAVEQPMEYQWRVNRSGAASKPDDSYHGLNLPEDEYWDHVEDTMEGVIDVTVGDHDLESAMNALTTMNPLNLPNILARSVTPANWYSEGTTGSSPLPSLQFPDSRNGKFGFPLLFPWGDQNYQPGFYTLETTARNGDGRRDTIEKDIAIDRDVLPILDHPEPMPVGTETPMDLHIAGLRVGDISEIEVQFELVDEHQSAEAPARSVFDVDETPTEGVTQFQAELQNTFNAPVPHHVTVTLSYNSEESVERTFAVHPKAQGPVPFLRFNRRPIPVGSEIEVVADVVTPNGEAANVDTTWRLVSRKDGTSHTTTTDIGSVSDSGRTLTAEFGPEPYRIEVEYDYEDQAFTPIVSETIHPELTSMGSMLAVSAESTTDDDEITPEDPARIRAHFPSTADDTVPEVIREQISTTNPANAFALRITPISTASIDGEADERAEEWFGQRREIEYTFDEPGRYEITAFIFRESAPTGDSGGIDDDILTHGTDIMRRSKTITVNSDAYVGLDIDGPSEVPAGTTVDLDATVQNEETDVYHYWWTFDSISPEGKTAHLEGNTANSVDLTIDDPEGVEVTLEIDTIGDGEPNVSASHTIETDDEAVAIDYTVPSLSSDDPPFPSDTDIEFEATVGQKIAEGEDVSYTWQTRPQDNKGSKTTIGSGTQTTHAFETVDVHDVELEVTYTLNGDENTKIATETLDISHAPAALAIGIEPPADCQSGAASTDSTTELKFERFALGVSGTEKDEMNYETLNGAYIAASGTGRKTRWQAVLETLTSNTGSYYDEFYLDRADTEIDADRDVRVDLDMSEVSDGSGPTFYQLLSSQNCENPQIVVRFDSVPETVEFHVRYLVEANLRAATPYVESRVAGATQNRQELSTPEPGNEVTGERHETLSF